MLHKFAAVDDWFVDSCGLHARCVKPKKVIQGDHTVLTLLARQRQDLRYWEKENEDTIFY